MAGVRESAIVYDYVPRESTQVIMHMTRLSWICSLVDAGFDEEEEKRCECDVGMCSLGEVKI